MDFNAEAMNWDTDKRVQRAQIIAMEIKRSIQSKEKCKALEFGCGTGLISFNLLDQFEHITLIDTSEGMIDKLNQKISDLDINNMTAVCKDINMDPLPSDKFDVIYTSMALHHISDIRSTLQNLYDLLNAKGGLCIVELNEDDGKFHRTETDFDGHNGFDQTQLRELLQQIGFNHIVSNTFYKDTKLVDDEKVDYSLFLMTGSK